MNDTIPFRIVPIDAVIADSVRREQRSPQYGHPATVEIAKGYGPCRQCLRTFRTGEEARILFTYDPVPSGQRPATARPRLHPSGGVHAVRPARTFRPSCARCRSSWRASAAARGPCGASRPTAEPIEADIAAMLRDPAIELVQIRNAEAGCFIARVERRRASVSNQRAEPMRTNVMSWITRG